MSIDWAATGNWMQAFAGFAQAGAIVVVAYKGADAFQLWKRQKVAERRLEVGERILTLAYRVRRAFEVIRSPAMMAADLASAEQNLRLKGDWLDKLGQDRRKNTIYAQAMFERLNSAATEWTDLLADIPVSRAVFGPQLEAALQRFWRQRGRVVAAVESYADDNGADASFSASIRRDIWSGWKVNGQRNEIDAEIAEAFAEVERIVHSALQNGVMAAG